MFYTRQHIEYKYYFFLNSRFTTILMPEPKLYVTSLKSPNHVIKYIFFILFSFFGPVPVHGISLFPKKNRQFLLPFYHTSPSD